MQSGRRFGIFLGACSDISLLLPSRLRARINRFRPPGVAEFWALTLETMRMEEQEPLLPFECERIQIDRQKLDVEREKLKVERSKAFWTPLSTLLPLIVAVATLAYGVISQTQRG